MAAMNPELAAAIIASSKRLGIDPVDLGTAISYETAGTLDPWKKGPTTQWGEHRGLLQWGEPQRAKYGVTKDMSITDQMKAAERYLTDAGVKPGHGLADIYSAVNAGHVGLYDRSDANNGGAPGTVMDKVRDQMAGHRVNAAKLLGMDAGMIPQTAQPAAGSIAAPPPPVTSATAAPAPVAPSADDGNAAFMASLANIPKLLAAQQASQQPAAAPAAPVPNNMAARLAMIAAAKQGIPST